MKIIKLFGGMINDGLTLLFPKKNNQEVYRYGFLVHPRDHKDIYRKYAFLRVLPRWAMLLFEKYMWSVTVSKITGLKDKEGVSVMGYVISIPMTAETMLEHRELALQKIRQAVKLARGKGVKVVGLGALTSSLTKGGKDLVDIKGVSITTGHTYTGYNVTAYLFDFAQKYHIDLEKITVAIVGAAGSIGSLSAQIIARSGLVRRIILIDIDRKMDSVDKLSTEIKKMHSSIQITATTDMLQLQDAHVIITATNAKGALVMDKMVKKGTVIIDDAQPSDVSDEVFERKDVLVLEAGAVHTPGITTNFNLGLHDRYDNFCCMAELLIYAHKKTQVHGTVGRADVSDINEMQKIGKYLGFSLPQYQNMYTLHDDATIEEVARILKSRLKE